LQFLPAFLPPEERIPSLTNEPKKKAEWQKMEPRFHLFPPFLLNEPGTDVAVYTWSAGNRFSGGSWQLFTRRRYRLLFGRWPHHLLSLCPASGLQLRQTSELAIHILHLPPNTSVFCFLTRQCK
jgi:hypothetical protein